MSWFKRALTPPKWRWNKDSGYVSWIQRFDRKLELPVQLWDIAESLTSSYAAGSHMAEQGLQALWEDVDRGYAAGASDREWRSLQDRWAKLTHRLFQAQLDSDLLGSEKLAAALDALTEVNVIDKENGLKV